MVARVVPQSARRRHAESRKPDLWGRAARPKAPVLCAQGGSLPYCAAGRVAEDRFQPLVLSTGLGRRMLHVRARQSETRRCGSRRSKLLWLLTAWAAG